MGPGGHMGSDLFFHLCFHSPPPHSYPTPSCSPRHKPLTWPPQNFLEGCPPTSPLDNKLSGESFQNKRNANLPPRNTQMRNILTYLPHSGRANRACFITPNGYLFSVNKKILFFVSHDRKPTSRELCKRRACASLRGLLGDHPMLCQQFSENRNPIWVQGYS